MPPRLFPSDALRELPCPQLRAEVRVGPGERGKSGLQSINQAAAAAAPAELKPAFLSISDLSVCGEGGRGGNEGCELYIELQLLRRPAALPKAVSDLP